MSTLRSILHTAPRSTIEHGLSFIDFSPPVNGSTPKAAATGNMPGMLGPSYERSGHPQRKRAHEGHRKANIIHTHTHNVYIYIYPSFLTFTLSCPCLLLRQQSFAPADGHKANVDNALSDIPTKEGMAHQQQRLKARNQNSLHCQGCSLPNLGICAASNLAHLMQNSLHYSKFRSTL